MHHAGHHPVMNKGCVIFSAIVAVEIIAYLWPRFWPCCTIELKPLPSESANPLIMVGRDCKSTKPSRLARIVGEPAIIKAESEVLLYKSLDAVHENNLPIVTNAK